MDDIFNHLEKGALIEADTSWFANRRFLKGERAVIVEVLKISKDASGWLRTVIILNPRGEIYPIQIRRDSVKIVERKDLG